MHIHWRKIIVGLKTFRTIRIGRQKTGNICDEGANDVARKHGRAYLTSQHDRINTGNAELLPCPGNHRYGLHVLVRAAHPAFQHQRTGIHLGYPQRLSDQIELIQWQTMKPGHFRLARIAQRGLGFHQLFDWGIQIRYIIL